MANHPWILIHNLRASPCVFRLKHHFAVSVERVFPVHTTTTLTADVSVRINNDISLHYQPQYQCQPAPPTPPAPVAGTACCTTAAATMSHDPPHCATLSPAHLNHRRRLHLDRIVHQQGGSATGSGCPCYAACTSGACVSPKRRISPVPPFCSALLYSHHHQTRRHHRHLQTP